MGEHGQHRTLVKLLRYLSLAATTAVIPTAGLSACRLALLLSMDVSSSMTDEEYLLQRDGLAAALVSKDVTDAILGSGGGHVALAAFEWSGRNQQKMILDWRELHSKSDVEQAALVILANKRSYSRYPTSLGFSLGYASTVLRRAPACDKSVLDVSGDGINNDGFGPIQAYQRFRFRGVTVNGLVITGNDPDVEWFYETQVLKGAFAFLETADNFADFERAMTIKLFREISNVQIGLGSTAMENNASQETEPKS